jgi:hypothetical protein
MRPNVDFLQHEQHLSRCAGEILKQMNELEKLRELVRLAKAAKASHRPMRLARRAGNSKVVDSFAGSQLRI